MAHGFTAEGFAKAQAGGGASELDDLSDVDLTTTAPENDDVLSFDGSDWVPDDPAGAGSFAGSVVGSDSSAGTNSHTLTMPAGIAADDLMVCYIACRNSTCAGPDGGGWTLLLSKDTASDERIYVWYKVAAGTETDIDITFSGTETTSCIIVVTGGTYHDFAWVQRSQSAPLLEASDDQFVIQTFHGFYDVSPWVMPTGPFGSSYTEAENETSGNAELMVAHRDAKYNGVVAPLTPTGGGGGGNQYQITTTLIVEPS